MAKRVYVSDSFTVGSTVDGGWHFTGPAPSDKTYQAGESVVLDWLGGEVSYIVYNDDTGGHNADVFMCLYDATTGAPVLVNGQPVILKWIGDAGNGPIYMGDAIMMNGVERHGQVSTPSTRYLSEPLRIGVAVPAGVNPVQVGSLFRFFGTSGRTLAYQYFLHCRVVEDVTSPPPPPPPATNYATLTLGGQTYQWPVEAI